MLHYHSPKRKEGKKRRTIYNVKYNWRGINIITYFLRTNDKQNIQPRIETHPTKGNNGVFVSFISGEGKKRDGLFLEINRSIFPSPKIKLTNIAQGNLCSTIMLFTYIPLVRKNCVQLEFFHISYDYTSDQTNTFINISFCSFPVNISQSKQLYKRKFSVVPSFKLAKTQQVND